MPAKNLLRVSEKGTYSHIYNKGVEERIIFNDDCDYEVFLAYLKDYLTSPDNPESKKKVFTVHGRTFRGMPHQPKNYFNKVELIGYSLMPNHFHLLLHQITKGSLPSFIRSLCTRYSMYFNKKYHRTGALFEGPYKSVQIKNIPLLMHLTAYIHQERGKNSPHSSYPEYLGKRETSWVRPDVVLSSTEGGNYRNLVENYKLNQKEEELLEGITLENNLQHYLERRVLAKDLTSSSTKIAMIKRMPEFVAIATVFFVLLGLGIRNINAQSATNSKPSPLSIAIASPAPSRAPSTPPSLPLVEEVASASTSAELKTMVVIKVDDDSTIINVRKNPTINSEKIGETHNGEKFELLSINSGWYEVKLADNTIGFIATEYAYLEQTYN